MIRCLHSDIGTRVLWDTAVTWRGHGTVNGYVFKDINANGIMEDGEPPLKKVRVFIGKKQSAFTNSRGLYRIRGVPEGSNEVSLDMNTLPKSYVSTTAVTVEVKIKRMGSETVNFGALPKTTITGLVFNDLNRNKTFDTGDEALPNVLVVLSDGKRTSTDSYGYFTIYNVLPGKNVVSVKKETVPKGLMQEKPLSHSLRIEEGERIEIEFVFYALRVIAGKVYIDYNENKRFDEGEAAGGIKILFQERSVLTDKDGNFILRNLPSGKIAMTVDKSNIPEGYIPEEDIIEVELKKGQDIKEDMEIRLIREP